ACENMIGGSQFLLDKVQPFLSADDMDYVDSYVGFPNAAVDRIVPIQQHEDPLFVSVEPFSEWLVDDTQSKAKQIRLNNVGYVSDLAPYIERKLFSVNTGHATTAYTGAFYGYTTIGEAVADRKVLDQLKAVLQETGDLLIAKWQFERPQHEQYIQKIIDRFKNPYISDDITRVARTPIRKLGYDERFIRPIREAKDYGLSYEALVDVVAMILQYDDPEDEESVRLQEMVKEKTMTEVIQEVTNLSEPTLVAQIVEKVRNS
ncbi:MAG: mannitol-1-phosphate 5-dehydrogenase, partial [Tetragenococcus halophilus]|nr:mannitol-1-phosphate 5-dehydrogenase [Tetragenococcus halophilus]